MLRPIPCLLCAPLFLVIPSSLTAQEPLRAWTVTIGNAVGVGGPSAGMGDRLTQAGFDDETSCFFSCPKHPVVRASGAQRTIAIGRRIGRRIEIRTHVSVGELGSVSGSSDGAMVARRWTSANIGAVVAFDVAPRLRVGTGPLLGWVRGRDKTPGPSVNADLGAETFRPGLLFEAGYRTSATKRVFTDFAVSYRLLSPHAEGPFPSTYPSGAPGPGLPRFDANCSAFTLGVGLGVWF